MEEKIETERRSRNRGGKREERRGIWLELGGSDWATDERFHSASMHHRGNCSRRCHRRRRCIGLTGVDREERRRGRQRDRQRDREGERGRRREGERDWRRLLIDNNGRTVVYVVCGLRMNIGWMFRERDADDSRQRQSRRQTQWEVQTYGHRHGSTETNTATETRRDTDSGINRINETTAETERDTERQRIRHWETYTEIHRETKTER